MDSAIERPTAEPIAWIDAFTGVILSPVETFSALADRGGIFGAIAAVCLVFALDGLRMTSGKELEWALVNVPASIVAGVSMWLFLAGLLVLLAACFNVPSQRLKALFVTTGWSYVPWIFMTPIWCYRHLMGHAFVLLAVIPLAWVFVCQMLAIGQTLKLKTWQLMMLVFAGPFLFELLQSAQFFQTLYVVFSAVLS